MSDRKIRGLEDQETHERKRLLRDVRSPVQQILDALKLPMTQTGGIVGAGVCLFFFPAYVLPLFAVGLGLAVLRLYFSKHERLPFRMPLGLGIKDRGDPLPGRRGYARSEGIFFLGNRLQDAQELWLKTKDILTHTLLFGTTGSGKTETLVSLAYNSLTTASGLFYIDPKASPTLDMQIWQMARFLGRDDDFRVLNYATSGKHKDEERTPGRISNTNNPFTFGSAEALTQLLVALMPKSDGGNAIFADKAQALISGIMYALVDLRDQGALKLSPSVIRDHLAIATCMKLADRPELGDKSRASIRSALTNTGWIAGREMKDQPQSFAEQFGYAQSYFGNILSTLTDTYSHIYGVVDGEVDFADCILQRRILLVALPALEKSPAELANLGKISLAAIRIACSVGLGANIEGNAADVLGSLPTDAIGIGPYLCIVDEYAAIVTPGFEVVLTQGRGLGIAAIVASQDYAGILEADKKGAQQMVANTSIKIFMKLQDAEKTWSLIKDLAGQGTVLRTSGFNVKDNLGMSYHDSLNTTVEQEDRVALRDLQEQIEGEAHFVFSGQIVRGDMFYANPSLKNAQLRVPQLVQVQNSEK